MELAELDTGKLLKSVLSAINDNDNGKAHWTDALESECLKAQHRKVSELVEVISELSEI